MTTTASEFDSVTLWVRQLKSGDEDAARKLWDRYFQRIVGLARVRLQGFRAAFDEEDVALSSFDRVVQALRTERVQQPVDRFEFWGLLRINLQRRLADRLKMEGAGKRGGGRNLLGLVPKRRRSNTPVDHLPTQDADPQMSLLMAETCREMLDSLQDDELQQVAIWKLEGLTDDEVAAKLGYCRRTVQRMLRSIRTVWSQQRTAPAE